MNDLKKIDIELVRELKRRGRGMEAKQLIKAHQNQLKKQRKEERKQLNRERAQIRRFKRRKQKMQPIKRIKDINDQTRNNNIQYYEGIYTKRWKTPNHNLMIELQETKILQKIHGARVSKKCNERIMNFLVPKRRQRVWKKIEDVEKGTKIKVKLIKEKRSKKFAVSEIFA